MTNALISYQFDADPIRVVMQDSEPWFVANDICKVLALANARKAVGDLDDDEKGVTISDTLGGRQELNIVSESGMFSLIFRSRKPEARRFRKWVTGEVLPELRRTGRFELPGAEDTPDPGDRWDPVRLNACIAVVREGRRLWGPDAARSIWIDMGLPIRAAELGRRYRDEAIEGPLARWLSEHPRPTLAEATGGIGLDAEHEGDRQRVRRAMRAMGWYNKRTRRDGELIWGWFAPQHAEVEG